MLRPERMSRVSVTGSRGVMADVIEAIHDLRLVDLQDYDGRWEGFAPGDPLAGAEAVSDQLVTVRSIETILDVDDLDADPARTVDDDYEAELEAVRERVNELDDVRDELRDERRALQEALDGAAPFVALGIDLDLLAGYDSLTVRVGPGDEDAVRAALDAAEAVTAVETFSSDGVVAAFAAGPASAVDEALVGVTFNAVAVPDAEGPPDAYVADLEYDLDRLEQRLRTVQDELEELKLDAGRFLLAVEARLAVEVRKAEAPLSFATTANAFVAEGWIPTDRLADLQSAIEASAGDHVEVEELERADYDQHGHVEHTAPTEAVEADGGVDAAMNDEAPPVVQENPGAAQPFEVLVRTISRPSYFELDPTVILFLTLPFFFGMMIGDVGYGLLYMLLGYALVRRYDTPGFRGLGGVFMWAGLASVVFGLIYGEVLGSHLIAQVLWAGHAPLHKGLEAEFAVWAKVWLVVAIVVGLVHLTVGFAFKFVNTLSHSLAEAVSESGSWLVLMWGVWIWIFSRSFAGMKPQFLYTLFDGKPVPLGFSGFPASVGVAAFVLALVGLVVMIRNEGLAGVVESLNVLTHVLSYSRLTAEILAEVGIAFVVNLLVFGAAEAGGFPGLVHMKLGVVGLLAGALVFVLGHAVVLALGVLSAGMQAIRLEYVEFFSKFYYEGRPGWPYEPFGNEGRVRRS